MPVIISNDPDVIALQRLEGARSHYSNSLLEIVGMLIEKEIGPDEARRRIAELKAWWKREMEEIKNIGAS